MPRKLQFRRGPESTRLSTVLANGEPGFATETNQLYVGDGIQRGGIPICMGHSHLLVNDTTAVVGTKYAFKAGCKLYLPDSAPDGSEIYFYVLASGGVSPGNQAKVITTVAHLRKGPETGKEYHTHLPVLRTALFNASETTWEIL